MRTTSVVLATLTLDGIFFVVNAWVFRAGGSHAVFSQAVSAATDLIGGAMILWGQWAAELPASPKHPFGRGKERFFWAYSAGLVTFSLAGALVLVEGIDQATNPKTVGDISDGLLTIAGTLACNLASLLVVLLELRRDGQTVQQLLNSSYQGVKTIFLQDVVSTAGGAVAFAGLAVVRFTGLDLVDGLSAAIVGALLLYAGFALAGEGRELLVGRAISEEEGRAILSLVERYPFVRHVLGMQSMLLGPEDRLVALRVNFMDEMNTDDVEMHIDQLRTFVRGEFPEVKHLLIEPVRAAEEGEVPTEPLRSGAPRGAATDRPRVPGAPPPRPEVTLVSTSAAPADRPEER